MTRRNTIIVASVAVAGVAAASILSVVTWGLKRSADGVLFGLLTIVGVAVRTGWAFGARAKEPIEDAKARRERSSSSDQAVLRALLAAFPPNELGALQREPSAASVAPSIEKNLRNGSLLHLRFIELGLEECRVQLMSAGSEWIDAIDRNAETGDRARRVVDAVERLSRLV